MARFGKKTRNSNRSSISHRSIKAKSSKSYDKKRADKSNLVNLGSITASKAFSREMGKEAVEDIKNSNFTGWIQVYLGNDENKTITLKNKQYILLNFREVDGAPDFVIGKASLQKTTKKHKQSYDDEYDDYEEDYEDED